MELATEIVKYPHPALRMKSLPVRAIDDQLREVVRRMFNLMYEAKGIGLAANQVALPWRLFVLNLTGDPAEQEEEHVFINPEILKRKGNEEGEEGCLSLPKLYADVRRSADVVIEAFDLDGEGFQMTLDGLAARCVQHESDHLDGVLFIDRLTDTKKREIAGILSDFEDQFVRAQEAGKIASSSELMRHLKNLEPA